MNAALYEIPISKGALFGLPKATIMADCFLFGIILFDMDMDNGQTG